MTFHVHTLTLSSDTSHVRVATHSRTTERMWLTKRRRWLMLLGGELYNAPITSSPQNILDLGTGTGIWAMDIAEYVKPFIVHFYIRQD